jgi:hypothetical protein
MPKLRYPLVATKKYPPPAPFAASGTVLGHPPQALSGAEGTATPSPALGRSFHPDASVWQIDAFEPQELGQACRPASFDGGSRTIRWRG